MNIRFSQHILTMRGEQWNILDAAVHLDRSCFTLFQLRLRDDLGQTLTLGLLLLDIFGGVRCSATEDGIDTRKTQMVS